MAAILIMVNMVANVYAQAVQTPASKAKQLQVILKLTDAQTVKITAVLQKIAKEEAADQQTQANLKKWNETHNMKAIYTYLLKQQAYHGAKIRPILTASQDAVFEELLTKQHDAFTKMAASQQ